MKISDIRKVLKDAGSVTLICAGDRQYVGDGAQVGLDV